MSLRSELIGRTDERRRAASVIDRPERVHERSSLARPHRDGRGWIEREAAAAGDAHRSDGEAHAGRRVDPIERAGAEAAFPYSRTASRRPASGR